MEVELRMRHVAAASLQRRLPVVVSGHDSVPVMKGRWPVVRVVGVVQVLGVVLVLRLPVGDTLVVVVWSVVLRMSAVVQAALRMAVGVSKWPRARDRTSRLLKCSWVGKVPLQVVFVRMAAVVQAAVRMAVGVSMCH